MLDSFANRRDLMFGDSDVPLLVTAQPVLMGFSLLSFQHWLMGTFFVHRARLYVLHLLLMRLPNQDWIQPSSLDIVPVLSLYNLSAFTPPTAPLQYLESQVDGPDLCFTRQVHHGGCVAYVAKLLPGTLAGLGAQTLWTFGSFHPSGNTWAVCEEVHSSSI